MDTAENEGCNNLKDALDEMNSQNSTHLEAEQDRKANNYQKKSKLSHLRCSFSTNFNESKTRRNRNKEPSHNDLCYLQDLYLDEAILDEGYDIFPPLSEQTSKETVKNSNISVKLVVEEEDLGLQRMMSESSITNENMKQINVSYAKEQNNQFYANCLGGFEEKYNIYRTIVCQDQTRNISHVDSEEYFENTDVQKLLAQDDSQVLMPEAPNYLIDPVQLGDYIVIEQQKNIIGKSSMDFEYKMIKEGQTSSIRINIDESMSNALNNNINNKCWLSSLKSMLEYGTFQFYFKKMTFTEDFETLQKANAIKSFITKYYMHSNVGVDYERIYGKMESIFKFLTLVSIGSEKCFDVELILLKELGIYLSSVTSYSAGEIVLERIKGKKWIIMVVKLIEKNQGLDLYKEYISENCGTFGLDFTKSRIKKLNNEDNFNLPNIENTHNFSNHFAPGICLYKQKLKKSERTVKNYLDGYNYLGFSLKRKTNEIFKQENNFRDVCTSNLYEDRNISRENNFLPFKSYSQSVLNSTSKTKLFNDDNSFQIHKKIFDLLPSLYFNATCINNAFSYISNVADNSKGNMISTPGNTILNQNDYTFTNNDIGSLFERLKQTELQLNQLLRECTHNRSTMATKKKINSAYAKEMYIFESEEYDSCMKAAENIASLTGISIIERTDSSQDLHKKIKEQNIHGKTPTSLNTAEQLKIQLRNFDTDNMKTEQDENKFRHTSNNVMSSSMIDEDPCKQQAKEIERRFLGEINDYIEQTFTMWDSNTDILENDYYPAEILDVETYSKEQHFDISQEYSSQIQLDKSNSVEYVVSTPQQLLLNMPTDILQTPNIPPEEDVISTEGAGDIMNELEAQESYYIGYFPSETPSHVYGTDLQETSFARDYPVFPSNENNYKYLETSSSTSNENIPNTEILDGYQIPTHCYLPHSESSSTYNEDLESDSFKEFSSEILRKETVDSLKEMKLQSESVPFTDSDLLEDELQTSSSINFYDTPIILLNEINKLQLLQRKKIDKQIPNTSNLKEYMPEKKKTETFNERHGNNTETVPYNFDKCFFKEDENEGIKCETDRVIRTPLASNSEVTCDPNVIETFLKQNDEIKTLNHFKFDDSQNFHENSLSDNLSLLQGQLVDKDQSRIKEKESNIKLVMEDDEVSENTYEEDISFSEYSVESTNNTLNLETVAKEVLDSTKIIGNANMTLPEENEDVADSDNLAEGINKNIKDNEVPQKDNLVENIQSLKNFPSQAGSTIPQETTQTVDIVEETSNEKTEKVKKKRWSFKNLFFFSKKWKSQSKAKNTAADDAQSSRQASQSPPPQWMEILGLER